VTSCIDIKEFARRCGVSVRTMEREKADGNLPPWRRIRGCDVWIDEDVDAYIRALPRFDAVRKRKRKAVAADEGRAA
jgi:predicted DNA-binding transcriptional regulator AlpA